MRRLHRRLELIAADRAHAARPHQQRLGVLDHPRIPRRRVLIGERHVVAARAAPRAAPGLRMQHQRQQAERLGLLRQQRGDEPAEPNAFGGEVAAAAVGAGGIRPAFREHGIDRFEHGIEPLAELGALGHAERNAGLLDLLLRAHQPLAHRGRRKQERRADRRGVEAEHGLQDQRRPDRGIDRGVGASEHQRQALVGNLHLGGRRNFQLLGDQPQMAGGRRTARPASRRIDPLAPRHGDQPSLRIFGNAAHRPIRERRREGVGQGVLGSRDVAGADREEGDELAVAAASQRFGGLARPFVFRPLHRGSRSHRWQSHLTPSAPQTAPSP